MGGSGGGGRYDGPSSSSTEARIQEARQRERERLDFDVNGLLQSFLANFNSRDRDLTTKRLDALKALVGERAEVDRILFGGSVAKHTEVDGLSDVDALVVLDRDDLRGASAQQVREAFFKTLNDGLRRSEVAEIRMGRLAVTVRYKDGMEVQLLPAVKQGTSVAIPSGDGGGWNITEPRAFQRALRQANDRLSGGLVPAIKLMKAVVSRFPEQKRLSGYHVEALSVEAARGYRGPVTPKALLMHLLDSASQRVLAPLKDRTGQSRHVDSYLGVKDSLERRNVSMALDGMRRRLEAATTVAEWRSVLE